MQRLKRVSINGEAYPVFYGMYGFALLMKKHGLKFNEVQDRIAKLAQLDQLDGDDILFLYDFLHAGFIMGSQVENKEFPYNVQQLSMHLPLQADAVAEVFQAFADSMPRVEEDNQKKAKPKAKAAT